MKSSLKPQIQKIESSKQYAGAKYDVDTSREETVTYIFSEPASKPHEGSSDDQKYAVPDGIKEQ